MRPTVLLPLALLAACNGPPDPVRSQPAPTNGESAVEPADPERSAELEALLPLSPERVCWYRLQPGAGRPRRVAFFLHQDGRHGSSWRSLGLSGLRLWRTPRAIWLLPGDPLRFGAVQVWAPAADDAAPPEEPVETAAGRFSCLRLEVDANDGTAVVWLARGVGLIGLELRREGEPAARLDLVETVPRGAPPAGYRRGTPDELWASLEEALCRLDPDGVSRLMGEELRARARRPRVDSGGPRRRSESGDPLAERIENELGELVRLGVARKGPWEVSGDAASAPGELSRLDERLPCRLLLRRDAQGWSWVGLEVAED